MSDIAAITPPHMNTPMWFADELEGILLGLGYKTEVIGDASDGGVIANVLDAAGNYMYTLTLTRTP